METRCKTIRKRNLLGKKPTRVPLPRTAAIPQKLIPDPQYHKPPGLFKQHDHTHTYTKASLSHLQYHEAILRIPPILRPPQATV